MTKDRDEASDYIWLLKVRNKALENRVRAFENGHAYQLLLNYVNHVTRIKDAQIKAANRETASAENEIVTSRNAWSQIFDDLDKEHKKEVAQLEAKLSRYEERILELERQRDTAKDNETEWRRKYYELSERLEEVEGVNQKLTAQVNKDFQNSSIPSSQQGVGRKKIPNSREKTDRKRGGQPGHEGHRLTQQEPTEVHELPNPEEYVSDPDYYPTEEWIKRQRIELCLKANIVEYTARVYRNIKTGSRVHATFPEGYTTDISYGDSVKGFAFLLANEGNMSAGKIREILSEVSGGTINISEATINGLCKEFSEKSEPEKEKIIRDLMESPVINADFTNANVNGNTKQVLIMASPHTDSTLLMARDCKGHKGIAGTPVASYVGTIVHDHDTTFYRYGMKHQECMQHNIRYLIGSIENEPEREWNKGMLLLLREMIHYRNSLDGRDPDPKVIDSLVDRYDNLLKDAAGEYEYIPPSDYYREGYNLYRRLVKYRESQLRFLYAMDVPSNNSLAERKARLYKRKQKQAVVLRSDKNFTYLCDALSVINTLRTQNADSLYDHIKEIFSREKPRQK